MLEGYRPRTAGEVQVLGDEPAHLTGMGFQWADIGVIAPWGVTGPLIAASYFRWKPTWG